MNRNNADKLTITLMLILALIFIASMLFPFYWMFITSVKPEEELYGLAVTYWPKDFTWES